MMTSWHHATSLSSLLAATHRAHRGKAGRPEVARFLMDAERACLGLQHALRLPIDHPEAWWPRPSSTFCIADPKPRTISVAPFPDRVVHHTLCAVLEPKLERYSIHHSYACWRGKGQHRALRQCQRLARRSAWAFKGDVASFFASVPHERLLRSLEPLLADAEVHKRVARTLAGPRPGIAAAEGRGLPIGALTSQHLANFYLGKLDHWLTDGLGFGRYLRYMDDFVVFGSRDELRALVPRIRSFLGRRLSLELNEAHSRLQPVRDGIPFLGFRVFPGQIRVSPERWRRFRRSQQALEAAYEREELDEEELARALSSLYAHLQAFDTHQVRRGYLRRLATAGGKGRTSCEPGAPGRLLEERPAQRTGRQPQQERPVQAQRQRRLSCCELNASAAGALHDLVAGPVGAGSRTGPLCPGIDQTPVPRSGPAGILIPALQPGTEPHQPGGGALRVAAGPLFPESS